MTTIAQPRRQPRSKALRALSSFLGLLIIIMTAWILWPASLGGRTQFIIVQGTSMEPTYHSGDLLFARKSDDYGPEDVVVYTIPEGEAGAGALVVHRIVSEDATGTYRLMGDNRDTLDDARPSPGDIIAKPVKNLGQLPTRLIILTPFFLSIVLGAAVAWFLWPASAPTGLLTQPGSEPDPDSGSESDSVPGHPEAMPPTEVATGLASSRERELASIG